MATLGANATSFTDSGLAPGTLYKYQIRAANDAGSSYPSGVASATTPSVPALAPAAPTNLAGTLNYNQVALTWADNSDNEETFLVQMIGYSGAFETVKEVPANATAATVYVHSAATNLIRVVARNTAGGNSDPSNVLSVVTKPEAPVYAVAQTVSSTAIDVAWDSLDSCVFHVERLDDGQWVRLASDLASLSYRDANLAPGTAHSYRVIAAAVNEAGESDPSDVVSAATAPAAVTGLAVTATTPGSVSLRWDDATGEAGYLVERSVDGVNWTTVALLYADVTVYASTGLQAATTYFFRVTGFANGVVLGDRGAVVTAKT